MTEPDLVGVKQIIFDVNKMDFDTAGYKQERYVEIAKVKKSKLFKIGWKKNFIEKTCLRSRSLAEKVMTCAKVDYPGGPPG